MGDWIPIKTRPLTEEEKKQYPDVEFYWDCPLPEDEQDVLITIRTVVGEVIVCTTFCRDCNESYFEDYDDADILAWMSFPEPYKENKDECY